MTEQDLLPKPPSTLRFKRVLLKISGEALMGGSDYGIDMLACRRLAEEVAEGLQLGAEICLVIGGGNIFRGVRGAKTGIDRGTADSMGMLATVMNALAMQSALESIDIPTRVQSAIRMEAVCEPFISRRAKRHMDKGRVVIFAAGTGNPYFTTDTGAALRAAQMGCDAMFKGTQVQGVYTADPRLNPDATRFEHITYMDMLRQDLKIMDATAISLMREANMPVVVFRIHERGALKAVLQGQGAFTVITNEAHVK
jgi:uridylate kinase